MSFGFQQVVAGIALFGLLIVAGTIRALAVHIFVLFLDWWEIVLARWERYKTNRNAKKS